MRLLDRYLLRELLLPLSFCLGGFLIFWMAFDLFTHLPEFQRGKMHVLDVAQYYLVSAPETIVLILPMALLLALLYALTNHARHNEITAMRAAGISLWRLSLPYLGVGVLLSGILFAVNERVVPAADSLAADIMTRRIRPPGQANEANVIRNDGFTGPRERLWSFDWFNPDTGEMRQIIVRWPLTAGVWCELRARRGIYTNGSWLFFNAEEVRPVSPNDSTLVPYLQTNVLARSDFTESPEEMQSELKVTSSLKLFKARRADIPIADLLAYLRLHPQLQPKQRAWLFTKLQGRFAAPWTCLVVVLIAIPFGVPAGRRNVFVGVASSIFICFAFFVLSTVSMAMGSSGDLPPWLAAWLPNLLFGGTAMFLMARVR